MSSAINSMVFSKSDVIKNFFTKHEFLNKKDFFYRTIENSISDLKLDTQTKGWETRVLEILEKKKNKYIEGLNRYIDILLECRSQDFDKQFLFAFQIGGRAENAFTEVHDIAFGIGRCVEECFPQLAKQWFGTKTSLHIDTLIELKNLEGYRITPYKGPEKSQSEKLFFLNFGSYIEGIFGEFHRFAFQIANNRSEAVSKVSKKTVNQFQFNLTGRHLDDASVVDDLQDIGQQLPENIHLKIVPGDPSDIPSKFDNLYKPLDFVTYDPSQFCDEKCIEKVRKVYQAWKKFVNQLKEAHSENEISAVTFSDKPNEDHLRNANEKKELKG